MADSVAECVIKTEQDRVKFVRRLESPLPFLKAAAEIVRSDCKKAFELQRLGDIKWPSRYPGQGEPFINVAGAVQDFIEGRSEPKERRFARIPANMDTGETARKIAAAPLPPDSFEVGGTTPQANRMQSGGKSRQSIDADTRARIAKWLGKGEKRKIFVPKYVPVEEAVAWAASQGFKVKKGAKRDGKGELSFEAPNPFVKKMRFLTRPATTSLTTEVVARPFIGLTDDMKADLMRWTAEYFATGKVPG